MKDVYSSSKSMQEPSPRKPSPAKLTKVAAVIEEEEMPFVRRKTSKKPIIDEVSQEIVKEVKTTKRNLKRNQPEECDEVKEVSKRKLVKLNDE